MKRPWHTWAAFSVCLALVLAAMTVVTARVVGLESAEAEARRKSVFEENVRLALWRLDSTISPVLAAESAQPYFAYSAFYPAERAYTKMFERIGQGDVLLPSPLLAQRGEHVLLHFQLGPDAELTSPQVPTGEVRKLAERYVPAQALHDAHARLEALAQLLSPEQLAVAIPRTKPRIADPVYLEAPPLPVALNAIDVQLSNDAPEQVEVAQQAMNVREYQARSQQLEANFDNAISYNPDNGLFVPATPEQPQLVAEGLMHPLWMDTELVLARHVSLAGKDYVQAVWIDWPAVRRSLLASIRDLLPDALLEAAREGEPDLETQSRLLASLPVRLVPGEISLAGAPGSSPTRWLLILAWLCVVAGALAVAALMRGALALSERRGAFVSAVTHELRTPLTTFQMYTEMLRDGMVRDEAKRERYVQTLHAEATRLGHLVENVLAYARLEKARFGGEIEELPLSEVLARSHERLAARAEQARMELVIDHDEASELPVRVDVAAMDRVLFNLVDNACKYAGNADDKRIHVEVGGDGRSPVRQVTLCVRDHGPGISPKEAKRLLRPFSKSATEAAHSAPGVGLGLALSRRLIRAMGGRLEVRHPPEGGACFAIRLPVA